MSTDPLKGFNTRTTPQTQPARPDQVRNAAGGYVFQVSDLDRLKRFLVLGSDANYYRSGAEMTTDNAEALLTLAETDHRLLVDTIVEMSQRGAAPKQNPTLFALALAASQGTDEEKGYALAQLPKVARTGTHLFLFLGYLQQFRGWGRALRREVGAWYLGKTADQVAYQAVKYRSREGWTHRDVLRKAHPETADPAMQATFDWITHGSVGEATPRLIEGFRKANEPGADVAALVRDYGLTWEMLPDEALGERETWEALLDSGIGLTALLRQLPRLTRLGLLPELGGRKTGRTAEVAALLTDPEGLRRARIHPVNVLIAQRTYAQGHSLRGDGTWHPARQIVDALDEAFYTAFGSVEPAGKRTLLALDVSGSMTAQISGLPISAREVSTALALVQMATEPASQAVGFTSGGGWSGSYHKPERRAGDVYPGLTPLGISPRQRLDDAVRAVAGLPFGRTNVALPLQYALAERIEVDTLVVYTDNETWSGGEHVFQALARYRDTMGIPTRLIAVGLTATECSIADPNDPLALNVAGFDAALPTLINTFSRGL